MRLPRHKVSPKGHAIKSNVTEPLTAITSEAFVVITTVTRQLVTPSASITACRLVSRGVRWRPRLQMGDPMRHISTLLATVFTAALAATPAHAGGDPYVGAHIGVGWTEARASTSTVFSATGYFAQTSVPFGASSTT